MEGRSRLTKFGVCVYLVMTVYHVSNVGVLVYLRRTDTPSGEVTLSEKGTTLKGKNLLPSEATAFI